ncbi:ABC transporter permease [Streptomyces sp. OfavH-34-F]|uniref:ABC transporter permease n=1 Tax=Streptomyces sp. OfavH-34-F TaxID=2917760 RepID=UPI001EF19066|nr:ABC transporter permease [Streptomyces sp. OfavH-34-F]MCG7527133.1 ABC transporter permease [Streptomyces sp. OfavH-34-F]
MTAPLTPPHRPSPDEHQHWQQWAEGGGGPLYGATWAPPVRETDPAEVRQELRRAGVVAAAVTVSGVLLGLLWLWLAPRVPLVSDGSAVFLHNSEGEESIGADGTFALLGLAFGAVSAGLAFWYERRGGIWLTGGLALGSVLGALVAWQVGTRLGPTDDVVAHAREAGKGVVFDAPLELHAKGMLLAWALAAMVVHLLLAAAWGPKEFEGEWASYGGWGPDAPPAPAPDGQPQAPAPDGSPAPAPGDKTL